MEKGILVTGQCPTCNSTNVEGEGVEIGESTALQEVSCADCEAQWYDHYALVKREMINYDGPNTVEFTQLPTRIIIEMHGGTIERVIHDRPELQLDIVITEGNKYKEREFEIPVTEDSFVYLHTGSDAEPPEVGVLFSRIEGGEEHLNNQGELEGEERLDRFSNRYVCPDCGEIWGDTWSCMCNDRCPKCDTETEPYMSEEYDEAGSLLDTIIHNEEVMRDAELESE